jgi:hypothetical protein
VDLEDLTQEDYDAELKLMFATDGWTILLTELKDQAYVINDLQAVQTPEDLHYRKGQLDTIGRLLNFEDTLRRAEAEEADREGP